MNKKYNQLEKQKNAVKEEIEYSILFTLPLTTTLILVLASIIHNYIDLDKLTKILGFIICFSATITNGDFEAIREFM